MSRQRNISDLLDANGDVKSTALDNVPASNDASALTTGTLPDARLSNQAKVVKGTSAPSNPQGGDLWYDTNTGINLLKVYNTTNAIWVATNVISPILTSATNIQNGQAENITLTGSNFGSDQGVISFTPSGGTATTVNATPTSDTSVTAAIPSAIYNQSVGTSIAITFRNNGGLTSAAVNKTVQVAITGGTKVVSGGYTYHTFTSSGNFVLGEAKNIEYLIIAGGGSAGSYAGGGGAGGVLSGTKSSLSAGTYAIVVGAGGATGSLDASNMFKPALARGEIQCIGATTLDEYRQNIEKDGALERRFQKVLVEPTSVDETIEILQNIKDKYEAHHNVNYTDEAIEACVKLSDRYITDRFLPDKAIDALDEAGSRAVSYTHLTLPTKA
mgnify:CR=1 FL=1